MKPHVGNQTGWVFWNGQCWEVELLKDMVAIPSPSRQEEKLAAFLVDRMTALGFRTHRDAVGNAVGVVGEGPRTLLLLGHLDTAAGEIPLRQEGDRLYGRGTVDAKGPLATFIAAAARVGPLPGWRIVIVGAVEEETETSRGARHLLTRFATPDGCVIGEPSGWDRVTLGYRGTLAANLCLRLPMAHSASPSKLPAERAARLWNLIVERCATMNAGYTGFDRLDPSLRHITTHDDGAYGLVEMRIGFRLPPRCPPETIAQALHGWLSAARLEDGGGKAGLAEEQAQLAIVGAEVAYRAPKTTFLVQAFLPAVRAEGGRPRFLLKMGTSDMNVVGPAWHCPMVAYGPGDANLDHAPDEHIDLREYLRAVNVLERALRSLGRGKDS